MTRGNENARRLFGKVVRQGPGFTRDAQPLGAETMEFIVVAVTAHYPRFRRLRHGLVLGELSNALVPEYEGAPVQFVYKVLASTVFFACLRTGGFSHADLETIEALYSL